MSSRPPRLARALVSLTAEPPDRPWILGDLDELYVTQLATRGSARASVWYWSQAVRSVLPLLGRRILPRNTNMIPPSEQRPIEKLASIAYVLRHATRRLLREPAFTVAAVLTLALGVGANVAVFAVVEAVLLRPLPYPEADRLVILNHRDQRTGFTKEFIAIGDYVDLAARQSAFEAFGAYSSGQATVFGAEEPYRVESLSATPGALEALRLKPLFGRSLEAADARQGAGPVVLLGYEYWRSKFGGDRRVLGRSIKIGQTDRVIVGVASPGFRFRATAAADVILPIIPPAQAPAQRKSGWMFAVGRLKPGHTLADAATDLAKVSHQLEEEYPESNRASSYVAVPLRDAMVGNTKPALVLLLAAVAVVLLIACANVANLLLARSLARRREMAVRMALGAGRGRLAVQLLSESLVLAIVAGVLGIALAHWGARALVAMVPQSVEVAGLADIHINASVLAFALAVTIATTLVFGLVAMLTVRLDNAAGVLVGAGRLSMSTGLRRATSGLVVVEVALAIVLLVGAGLIMRTFAGLLSVDPGFRIERVMTMDIALPADRYREQPAREGYYRNAFAALRAVPGVESVGAAAVTPLTGNNWTVGFERPEQPVAAGERPPEVGWQAASGGYFTTLGIPLVGGRLFDERDTPASAPVVIVSEAIQRRFFGGESAVGHLVKTGDTPSVIVGVVGNIRRAGLRDEPRADMYFPFERGPSQSTTLFVRTAADPSRALQSLQGALRSVDTRTIFLNSETLAEVASESVRVTKLILWLLSIFAATALLLAALGIYGVMSYVVRQRTREIGTRIALGATRRNIVWLVMRQGAIIAAAGTVAGLAVGLAASRTLASILYGVTATDPTTLVTSAAVLIGTTMAACYVPARRAAAVDPVTTLADSSA